MRNEFKGEINLEVFFRTFWFAFLTLLAILLEIILLPILFIVWIISAGKYNIFIKTTKIIVGKGIYLLFTLNLKDFRKNLREIEKKKNPRIYILNHASIFDIILLFSLPDCVKILVKESYTRVPIIGSLIKLNGHIVVKNSSNYDDTLDMYENVVKELKNGASIAIFPEGTRSKDGNISRFKTGAFKIAYETQADIIPIVMDAWNIIRPKDGIWFRENALFSKVLPIQRYEEYKDTDLRELGKTLRNKMALELFKIREERKKNEAKYYRKKSPFLERDEEEFNRRKDSERNESI